MKLTLEEVTVFLTVVDTGSLTAAAEHLGQPVSTTSRLLARLEDKLQTTLLRRTTRRLDLTDEGCNFVHDARQILESVRVAEDRLMERRGRLAGPLHIDAASPFVLHVLVPLLPGYRALHPGVDLVLNSNEGFIDLLERRVDLAIRIGELKDSTLHSRLLGQVRNRLVASPDYLARRGTPADAEALRAHELLGFSQPEALNLWPVQHADGRPARIQPTLLSSSGETLRQMAIAGMGITYLGDFMTARDIAQGRLVEVLPQATLYRPRPVHAVYHQQSAVSVRIASMVGYLAEAMRAPEAEWATYVPPAASKIAGPMKEPR
ncbi:LysR family transcriptional regulator [Pseudorhodoferax sp. Leaf265]|uniref:LysR family transcriptional regulator n=1 Tax=Pseudorhodoferax sp. Leaf265 TaxID=1736315 RepID=UPI000700BE4D|nr:LysR family transcriptional regulator [Pseudorhodoferax sp. Leaf265]KQP16209.1 LysR family transcriptional regulator [Pseudorhodoferax sp. Leaf265]PZQ00337.1 MAG: LysR family transcriptional regulator [Variovorax paradoxus]PZQ12759.1 MAG: LysR family transcriptional regulator [Variovorax paradoxus]